ncbi:MAG: hypothetical protein JSS11_02805 [Verrucomicrobia bacterium]|nr:hypothetical protein [Verrucomicrobiota bacterium]
MKKTFPLQIDGKDDARVRDKIRQEINNSVRRARAKKLPEGFDSVEFACRVGASAANAEARGFKEIGAEIDRIAGTGATEVYVEITAEPVARKFRR